MMTDTRRDSEPKIPIDSDELSGDEQRKDKEQDKQAVGKDRPDLRDKPNPPHTTRGIFTAPKFGSAGSGGLEIEPGPEKD